MTHSGTRARMGNGYARGRVRKSGVARCAKDQGGFALIEALISIVVLSVGVVGLLFMNGFLISSATVSNQRLSASLLADELITMAQTDPTNAGCYATTGVTTCASVTAGQFRTDWVNRVKARLPGASSLPPVVDMAADRTFTVTLQWRQKDDGLTRNHRIATQIGS